MSGGSMEYYYARMLEVADRVVDEEDGLFEATTAQRAKFKTHLQALSKRLELAAFALQAIESNDSGDGAKDEDERITRCIGEQPNLDEEMVMAGVREIASKADYMQLNLLPLSAMHIVGLMQLALKHPELPPTHEDFARHVVEVGRQYFADCPSVLQVIEAADRSLEAERAARSS